MLSKKNQNHQDVLQLQSDSSNKVGLLIASKPITSDFLQLVQSLQILIFQLQQNIILLCEKLNDIVLFFELQSKKIKRLCSQTRLDPVQGIAELEQSHLSNTRHITVETITVEGGLGKLTTPLLQMFTRRLIQIRGFTRKLCNKHHYSR